eukprot:7408319-Pyramimonas_sp.AAC.1
MADSTGVERGGLGQEEVPFPQNRQTVSSPLGTPQIQHGDHGPAVQTQDIEAIRGLVGRSPFAPIRPLSPA